MIWGMGESQQLQTRTHIHKKLAPLRHIMKLNLAFVFDNVFTRFTFLDIIVFNKRSPSIEILKQPMFRNPHAYMNFFF